MTENKFLNAIKKTWDFLWNGDSWLSWITFIIVIFIFIRFIFFPGISLITGTQLPIVIVESCSMYHGDTFSTWWNNNKDFYIENNMSKTDFQQFTLPDGFAKGDIFFVTGVKPQNIKVGDVIIFQSGNQNRPIIHRVVSTDPLQTKGDNNIGQFSPSLLNNPEKIDETNISPNQIIGKVVNFKIPFLGWLKLIFYEPFRDPSERGFCQKHP